MFKSSSLTIPAWTGEYQKASTVVAAGQPSTGAFVQSGSRIVATTITQGHLTLRYTPQEPKQERIPTT